MVCVVCVAGCDTGLFGTDSKPNDSGTLTDTGATPQQTTNNPPTSPTSDLDCDANYNTPAPGNDLGTCITGEVLQCGDVVYGTLDGGSSIYDYDYWYSIGELDALFGRYDALDGEERVYVYEGLFDSVLKVTFETCFDLWATWVLTGQSTCDVESFSTGGVFEGGTGRRWFTERLNAGTGPHDYQFILEGLDGATGNYAITVECL